MSAPAPMEALLADELPDGKDWQFEPKWDGFRCIAAKVGGKVELWSKSGKPLGRYFPAVTAMIERLGPPTYTIDGELLIAAADEIRFDALQLRLHPAASRVARLSTETPATFMAFDCLRVGRKSYAELPLPERRSALESLLAEMDDPHIRLSPATTSREMALGWLRRSGGALDGVIAKRIDEPYRAGQRAMFKVKQQRTADCVVGGFRYASKQKMVGSLLLGLYDAQGRLDHVGFTSALKAEDRDALTRRLEKLAGGEGFTGDRPGGPSRWATDRSAQWVPLKPELVVEVRYGQVTAGRFRHGTGLLRWRPDKAPRQCTRDQLAPPLTPAQVDALMT